MSKKRKGFSTILVVAIVLVVIAGGFLTWQYWPEPADNEQPETEEPITDEEIDETANWQVYRNNEYGFEIKYPNDIIVKDWTDGTPNWKVLIYIGENIDIGDGAVMIGIEQGINNLNDLYEKSFDPKIQNQNLEDVVIGRNSYAAKKFILKSASNELIGKEVNSVSYFVEYFGTLYTITYDKISQPLMSEEVFDQMLSTFRFLD